MIWTNILLLNKWVLINFNRRHEGSKQTTYFDGSREIEEAGLGEENLARESAEVTDFGLRQWHLLPSFHIQ